MNSLHTSHAYELRFNALFADRRSFSFPCDAVGHVDMDSLSERALNNYLYARAMMGLEVSWPDVCPAAPVAQVPWVAEIAAVLGAVVLKRASRNNGIWSPGPSCVRAPWRSRPTMPVRCSA